MQTVTKEQFYEKLMSETRDVVTHCQFIDRGHYVTTCKYRNGELFGTIDTRHDTYPSTQVFTLAGN